MNRPDNPARPHIYETRRDKAVERWACFVGSNLSEVLLMLRQTMTNKLSKD